jgi:hypothetical protein
LGILEDLLSWLVRPGGLQARVKGSNPLFSTS